MKDHVPFILESCRDQAAEKAFMMQKGIDPSSPRGQKYNKLDGCYLMQMNRIDGNMRIIAGSDPQWEHVSASFERRCPTWNEMSMLKSLFWDDDECVLQYHPPRTQYVNIHPFTLHLWKPVGFKFPIPPMHYV